KKGWLSNVNHAPEWRVTLTTMQQPGEILDHALSLSSDLVRSVHWPDLPGQWPGGREKRSYGGCRSASRQCWQAAPSAWCRNGALMAGADRLGRGSKWPIPRRAGHARCGAVASLGWP